MTLSERAHYKILSVEDNADYQAALMNSLSSLDYADKTVEFLTASSAEEASRVIASHPDLSIILLDVVMETDEAGLRLIDTIRDGIGNDAVRIVLLTGQPGMAPIDNLMQNYDIDDYWCKSDLTHDHLQTIILSNLRTWHHLKSMQEARYSLQLLVESSRRLGTRYDLPSYSHAILEEISQLFKLQQGGIVCLSSDRESNDALNTVVVAASGVFSHYVNRHLKQATQQAAVINAVQQAIESKQHVFIDGYSVLYFEDKQLYDHEYVMLVCQERPLTENEISLLHVFCENINAGFRNVALHSKLTKLAYYDLRTNLCNNNWLERELRNLSQNDRQKSKVLTFYIKGLSVRENRLGQGFGDQLLNSFHHHLRAFFGAKADIALVERDTFVVLDYDEKSLTSASLESLIHSRLVIEKVIHNVDVVVSVVHSRTFPDYDAARLLSAGKSALERAQRKGVNFLIYSEALSQQLDQSYALLQNLREAIINDEITIYLQPKVHLKNGRLIGFEALARWQDSEGNFIPPFEFISLAENAGLIEKLDYNIMRQSCRAAKVLQGEGIHVPISVNVTGAEITRSDYVPILKALFEEERLPKGSIEIEITESQLIEDQDVVSEKISELQQMGVSINIDDFGTGYSSLAYLSTLPVSTLKIDQRFVWRMEQSPKDLEILKMVIALGASLGLNVIAEGIESEQQKALLSSLGCLQGQGFLFAKPLPLNDALIWSNTVAKSLC